MWQVNALPEISSLTFGCDALAARRMIIHSRKR
jgi:hypothetical protein